MNLIELASASDLIDSGIAVLKQILPSSWQVVRLQDDLSVPTRADAVLHIGPTNQVSRVVMEARKSFSPRDVDGVIGRAQLLSRVGGEVPYLVVAPWLSERSRSLLAEAGLNYVDLAGNIRVATNYPSLFVLKDSKTNA